MKSIAYFLVGFLLVVAAGVATAAPVCSTQTGTAPDTWQIDTGYTPEDCPTTGFVVTSSTDYADLVAGQSSLCSSGDTACLQLAFDHSVWDQPTQEEYLQAWFIGFGLPVMVFLVAWGAGRVVKFIH